MAVSSPSARRRGALCRSAETQTHRRCPGGSRRGGESAGHQLRDSAFTYVFLERVSRKARMKPTSEQCRPLATLRGAAGTVTALPW